MQSQANVEKIADLARLSFSEEERDELQEQFQKILGYFEQIQGLETDNVDPMVTPHQYPSALREDRVDQDLSLQDILKNAPDVKDDLFKVPPVV
ncbi:MAG: Asp-tRNA(Asn)/Glu-tRNA(Gln) amidotransferase subunit GatC [Pseudomonadota bacterium]